MLTRSVALYSIAGAAVAGLTIGAAGGWIVNGWRLERDVARLVGVTNTQQQAIDNAKGVNDRCLAGLDDVKGSVKALVVENRTRSAAAQAAIERAAKKAERHLKAATDALNRPMPAPGKECDALVREALDYARQRKGQTQ